MSMEDDRSTKMLKFVNKEPEKEVIHSGHFMVSDFEADDEDDAVIPLPEESIESKISPPKLGITPKVTSTDKQPASRHELSIETSLTKLFQCMSLAYRQKLTSPKWNRFKGIRLRWKDKIRLNNVIWRCWHVQFINKKRTLVCQFASPMDLDTHNKPEAVVMEGKYWKRRLNAVTAEYKKWRMYYRNILLGKKDAHEMMFEFESLEWPGSVKDAADLTLDDMVFMSDSLFTTITANQPFAFPDHREIAHRTSVADFIQPTLVQLQPNLDDFMDLEPFQELIQAKIPVDGCDESVVDNKIIGSGALVSSVTEKAQTSWAPPPLGLPPSASSQIISSANYIIKKPPITTTTNVYPLFKGTVPSQLKGFKTEELSNITIKSESRDYDLIIDSGIKNEKAATSGPSGSTSWKEVGTVSSPPSEIQPSSHLMYLAGPVSPGSPVNSTSMSPISLELIDSPSPTSSVSSLPSKMYRRGGHVNAEQKRRCNIKNGFDILLSLLPRTHHSANSKVSKAGVLQKAVEYIKQLRAERLQLEEEIKSLKNQVEFHNNAISNCQEKLPATGAPISKTMSTKIVDMFRQHIKIRTEDNWKYWIFSLICEPLMSSFADCVSTASMDHLYSTTLQWVDQYCSLILLRPIVLNALKRLCTTTDVLTNPKSLEKEIKQALKNNKKSITSPRDS